MITRPRRFGKTLTMSMLEYFFSDRCKEQAYLFEDLKIWQCGEEYRRLQGSVPVINITFINVRYDTMKETYNAFKGIMADIYLQYEYLLDSDVMNTAQQATFRKIMEKTEDEYDAPLQEAYVSGYWDKITNLMVMFFLNTFKNNPSLDRAILTGVTRVSKESIFFGLNNLKVITTTSKRYADCFGFTEEETFAALDMYDMSNEKEHVKEYYDGFIMGKSIEIYNPWLVINFLSEKEYKAYWANTSANKLIGVLIGIY